MIKIHSFGITILLASILITSCNADSINPTPNIAGTAAAMAETILAGQLTKIGEATPQTLTSTPSPTNTARPTMTPEIPTLFPSQQTNSDQATIGTCLLAHMISETIPDNTEVEQGELIEKTWVLQNNGTCT